MSEKPLALEINIRVSKLLSVTGEAPRWRSGFNFSVEIGAEAQAILHNVAKWLRLNKLKHWVVQSINATCQNFWIRVGDSSYDPVLKLQNMAAFGKRICVITRCWFYCKAIAQSLVLASAN